MGTLDKFLTAPITAESPTAPTPTPAPDPLPQPCAAHPNTPHWSNPAGTLRCVDCEPPPRVSLVRAWHFWDAEEECWHKSPRGSRTRAPAPKEIVVDDAARKPAPPSWQTIAWADWQTTAKQLVGVHYPPREPYQIPAEILATPDVMCEQCRKRRVLPSLPIDTQGLCYSCATGWVDAVEVVDVSAADSEDTADDAMAVECESEPVESPEPVPSPPSVAPPVVVAPVPDPLPPPAEIATPAPEPQPEPQPKPKPAEPKTKAVKAPRKKKHGNPAAGSLFDA